MARSSPPSPQGRFRIITEIQCSLYCVPIASVPSWKSIYFLLSMGYNWGITGISESGTAFVVTQAMAADSTDWREVLGGIIVDVGTLMAKLIGDEIEKKTKEQDLLSKFAMLVAAKKIREAMTPYISTVITLAFNSSEISEDSVNRLLDALGVEKNGRFLSFVLGLNFKNSIPYVPALYYLRVVGKEPDAENMSNLVRAMGISPDVETAQLVLGTYKKYELAKQKPLHEDEDESDFRKDLDSSIIAASTLTARLILYELYRTYEKKDIQNAVTSGFIPYLSANGVLAFVGRDMTPDGKHNVAGIRSILESVGITPDQNNLDYLERMDLIPSPAVYSSALHLLLSVGKAPTVNGIIAIADAMGIKADEALAGYILTLYKDYGDSKIMLH